MNRQDALNVLSALHRLAKADETLLIELNNNLSPAEQSVLRSCLQECGKRWGEGQALMPRGRTKGASV